MLIKVKVTAGSKREIVNKIKEDKYVIFAPQKSCRKISNNEVIGNL
jgi:hypothetical protein